MGVQQLNYYRINCDREGCAQRINIAAPTPFELQSALDTLKNRNGTHWVVKMVTQDPLTIRAWCPEHMPKES